MFQSRLSDIVERLDRARTEWRFFSQFKISCQKIEALLTADKLDGRRAVTIGKSVELLGLLSRPVAIQGGPLAAFERAVKRIMDVVGSATAILFLWPLLLLAAIAIKLDSGGPIIFQQRRTGLNGKEFVIFKFRTMTVLEDGPAITQACRGDLRTTRVGKFLRRSSIDELPQLLNVLKGDMSLVGPRPHAVAHDREYKVHIADYGFRDHVKPGITGWAQVNGLRGETRSLEKMAERVKFDLWYIDNWSLGFDINILLRTCFEVLRDRAY